MNRITTGLFKPKQKRMAWMTAMICLETDCGYTWSSSRISNPCPKCASETVMPLANWQPAKYGMPRLTPKVKKS